MSRRLLPTLRTVLAATVAFITACLLTRLILRQLMPVAGTAPDISTANAAATPAVSVLGQLEAVHFAALSNEERVALGIALRSLTQEDRERRLSETLTLEEPERTSLLCLLLSAWAECDPAAAGDWALQELKGDTFSRCLRDISETWAARDGLALAHWWNESMALKNTDGSARETTNMSFGTVIRTTLLYRDPIALAHFQEMACMKDSTITATGDMVTARWLATPEQIRFMAKQVAGHVAYESDAAKLNQRLSGRNSMRHVKQKGVWNEIFEETAVAWHRSDPAACVAWLVTFPENAQAAARHFIAEDEKSRAKPTDVDAPEPPNPTPIPPQQRLTTAPPVPGPHEDAARKDWSDWWREDAAAAEAFLNTSAWSDDLKFRARANAYSSAP